MKEEERVSKRVELWRRSRRYEYKRYSARVNFIEITRKSILDADMYLPCEREEYTIKQMFSNTIVIISPFAK